MLDLCSSWVSHLPEEVDYARVVGHGLNAEELGRNRALSDFFVRDLNASPTLRPELQDASFDAVVCCVSVQYLQRPEAVFAEVFRVLKPGGVAIFSFSNRMFYSKAIAAWRDGTGCCPPHLRARAALSRRSGAACAEALLTPGVTPGVTANTRYSRAQLVKSYFAAVTGFTSPEALTQPAAAPPVDNSIFGKIAALFARSASDPFHAVVAYRNFKPTS